MGETADRRRDPPWDDYFESLQAVPWSADLQSSDVSRMREQVECSNFFVRFWGQWEVPDFIPRRAALVSGLNPTPYTREPRLHFFSETME